MVSPRCNKNSDSVARGLHQPRSRHNQHKEADRHPSVHRLTFVGVRSHIACCQQTRALVCNNLPLMPTVGSLCRRSHRRRRLVPLAPLCCHLLLKAHGAIPLSKHRVARYAWVCKFPAAAKLAERVPCASPLHTVEFCSRRVLPCHLRRPLCSAAWPLGRWAVGWAAAGVAGASAARHPATRNADAELGEKMARCSTTLGSNFMHTVCSCRCNTKPPAPCHYDIYCKLRQCVLDVCQVWSHERGSGKGGNLVSSLRQGPPRRRRKCETGGKGGSSDAPPSWIPARLARGIIGTVVQGAFAPGAEPHRNQPWGCDQIKRLAHRNHVYATWLCNDLDRSLFRRSSRLLFPCCRRSRTLRQFGRTWTRYGLTTNSTAAFVARRSASRPESHSSAK
jgi:hypothetical protein